MLTQPKSLKKMEDINQDGNSEIARNRAIVGSRSSQIETTAKK